MSIRVALSDEKITAYLSGDLDHHTAKEMRMNIDKALTDKPGCKALEIDFSNVSFMDSSGIGLIMGRYKLMCLRGGRITVLNPPPYIARVMNLAGVNRLARITYTASGVGEEDLKEVKDNEESKAD